MVCSLTSLSDLKNLSLLIEANSYTSSAIKTTKTITAGKNWSVQMGIGSITSKVSDCYDSAKKMIKSAFNM